jgi:hypothetical protein
MRKLSLPPISVTILFLAMVFWPASTLAQLPSFQGTWELTYVSSEEGGPAHVGHGAFTVCQYDYYADLVDNSSPFIYIPDPTEEDDPLYGFVWPDGRLALFKDGYSKFGGNGVNFGLEIIIGTLNKRGDKFKARGTGFDSYIPHGGIWTDLEIQGRRISADTPPNACPDGGEIFPIPPPNFRK